MHCPKCHTENRDRARRCRACGTPLTDRCPTCGEPVLREMGHCVECGTLLPKKKRQWRDVHRRHQHAWWRLPEGRIRFQPVRWMATLLIVSVALGFVGVILLQGGYLPESFADEVETRLQTWVEETDLPQIRISSRRVGPGAGDTLDGIIKGVSGVGSGLQRMFDSWF